MNDTKIAQYQSFGTGIQTVPAQTVTICPINNFQEFLGKNIDFSNLRQAVMIQDKIIVGGKMPIIPKTIKIGQWFFISCCWLINLSILKFRVYFDYHLSHHMSFPIRIIFNNKKWAQNQWDPFRTSTIRVSVSCTVRQHPNPKSLCLIQGNVHLATTIRLTDAARAARTYMVSAKSIDSVSLHRINYWDKRKVQGEIFII